MDRNFHIDDFERLLREKSEEFRMYPSKRIWYSIYNNIHPSRKWPSVVMTITLITGLLLIGYLNTNNTSFSTQTGTGQLSQKFLSQKNAYQIATQKPVTGNLMVPEALNKSLKHNKVASLNSTLTANTNNSRMGANNQPEDQTNINKQPPFFKENGFNGDVAIYNSNDQNVTNTFITADSSIAASKAETKTRSANPYFNDVQKSTDVVTDLLLVTLVNIPELLPVASDINIEGPSVSVLEDARNKVIGKIKPAANAKISISEEDRKWIENYGLYHKPAAKKWANKLELQLYATPSVVYRILYNNPSYGNLLNATPFAVSPSNQDINLAVINKPSIGFEIGAGFKYSVFKDVKLKAGLQFNYTRYNSNAFQNTHPVSTRLLMHDNVTNISYEEYRTTPYSNKSGLESVKLHNQTFQVALPIGADLKLIGNKNLQWNAGVTLQPTYVAWGKSYLISSDRRNYVKESAMINNWNLNAGFETFITFKSNGLTYQLGPQFRTQLFSTNNKKYAVEEKLFNVGLKFGISKNIK